MELFRKLQVITLSSDFREACKVVGSPFRAPTPDEVEIKNYWSAVNATDVNKSAGRYVWGEPIPPYDIGYEGHGIVTLVGCDVTSFKVGDAVLYLGPSGGYSEYIYASTTRTFPIILPAPSVKKEYLCALNCGLTAAIALSEKARIHAGDKVLITAAAGGTGHIAVQWAKMKGSYVIGITSADEKADFLKSIGADHVINYKKEDLDSVLKESYPEGVDVIWETIGGKTFEMLFDHLALHGRMITLGGISGYLEDGFPEVRIDHMTLLLKSLTVIGFKFFDNINHMPGYSQQLISLIDEGKLKVKLDQGEKTAGGLFMGLEGCIRAVEHLIRGKNVGRVIVQIN